MNVLILGSGGREHSLAWKIAQSPKLSKLYIAPGNAGTKDVGENIDLSPTDFKAVKQSVLSLGINLVLVGPEDPLVKGIRDFFLADAELKNIPVIGPDKRGAELEGSKEFAKEIMYKAGVNTARYRTCHNEDELRKACIEFGAPYVIKHDGLAAGKGVLILNNLQEAKDELTEMLANKKFGSASNKVVIEEFLTGIELSCFVLTDGKSYVTLPSAKDYKRIGEGDYMFSGDDKYLVFDSNKNHLLTLTPRNQHDNNETIETIEIVSSFFKTDNGVTIESTFGMIEKHHKINSIQNTINNLIIYVDEIDAYFIIDKQNLPIDLRLGTEKIIKSINIPPESKIKRFMIGWN